MISLSVLLFAVFDTHRQASVSGLGHDMDRSIKEQHENYDYFLIVSVAAYRERGRARVITLACNVSAPSSERL